MADTPTALLVSAISESKPGVEQILAIWNCLPGE